MSKSHTKTPSNDFKYSNPFGNVALTPTQQTTLQSAFAANYLPTPTAPSRPPVSERDFTFYSPPPKSPSYNPAVMATPSNPAQKSRLRKTPATSVASPVTPMFSSPSVAVGSQRYDLTPHDRLVQTVEGALVNKDKFNKADMYCSHQDNSTNNTHTTSLNANLFASPKVEKYVNPFLDVTAVSDYNDKMTDFESKKRKLEERERFDHDIIVQLKQSLEKENRLKVLVSELLHKRIRDSEDVYQRLQSYCSLVDQISTLAGSFVGADYNDKFSKIHVLSSLMPSEYDGNTTNLVKSQKVTPEYDVTQSFQITDMNSHPVVNNVLNLTGKLKTLINDLSQSNHLDNNTTVGTDMFQVTPESIAELNLTHLLDTLQNIGVGDFNFTSKMKEIHTKLRNIRAVVLSSSLLTMLQLQPCFKVVNNEVTIDTSSPQITSHVAYVTTAIQSNQYRYTSSIPNVHTAISADDARTALAFVAEESVRLYSYDVDTPKLKTDFENNTLIVKHVLGLLSRLPTNAAAPIKPSSTSSTTAGDAKTKVVVPLAKKRIEILKTARALVETQLATSVDAGYTGPNEKHKKLIERKLIKTFNKISANMKSIVEGCQSMMSVCAEVMNGSSQSGVSVKGEPALTYALLFLADKLSDNTIDSHHTLYCYAHVVHIINQTYPQFHDIFMAVVNERCVWTIPYYFNPDKYSNSAEYKMKIGYQPSKEDPSILESTDTYFLNQTNSLQLMVCYLQVDVPGNNTSYIAELWAWIAALCNMQPSIVHFIAIEVFLKFAGSKFLSFYKQHAQKLFRVIQSDLLPKLCSLDPKLTGGAVGKASYSVATSLLKDWKQTSMIEIHVNRNLPIDQDSSQHREEVSANDRREGN